MNRLRQIGLGIGTGRLWLSSLFESPLQERPVEKILVLGYAAIGDLIFFLPVLQALRRHYRKAKIVFVANDYPTTRELLPAFGLTDEIWLAEWEGRTAAADRGKIVARIKEHGFDLALLTLSSPAHYFQDALRDIPVVAGHCRVLTAPRARGAVGRAFWRLKRALVTGELARRLLVNRPAWVTAVPEHALTRNFALLDALGIQGERKKRPRIPLSVTHQSTARRALADLPPGKKLIGLHLGSPKSLYGKMWGAQRYGALCARINKEWPVRFAVVGDEDEKEVFKTAEEAAGVPLMSFVGGRSLLNTFALIERCDLFISNDTGLAKAAMAMGIPTATVWGPIDDREFGVVWEAEKHIDIRSGIDCSPCARMGMPAEGVLNFTSCGHHDCLGRLEVGRVFSAIKAKYGNLLSSR